MRDIAAALGVREADVRRLLKLLGRMGQVDEVAHDHFFLRATVAEMVEIAADVAAQAEKGEFTAAQFRDRLDNGRKVAIQILEFFDRHGVTMRRGDLRRINQHRLDLFRRRRSEPRRRDILEEKRPRWGVRTSNPGGAASRSLVGSTPSLFRHTPGAHDDRHIVPRRAEDGAEAAETAEACSGARSRPHQGAGAGTRLRVPRAP